MFDYQWLETIDWTDSFQQSTPVVTSVTQWCERKPMTDLFRICELQIVNTSFFRNVVDCHQQRKAYDNF